MYKITKQYSDFIEDIYFKDNISDTLKAVTNNKDNEGTWLVSCKAYFCPNCNRVCTFEPPSLGGKYDTLYVMLVNCNDCSIYRPRPRYGWKQEGRIHTSVRLKHRYCRHVMDLLQYKLCNVALMLSYSDNTLVYLSSYEFEKIEQGHIYALTCIGNTTLIYAGNNYSVINEF